MSINKTRLGILGGAFDPVHNGHIKMAEAVLEHLKLDKLLMVPASLPPHKAKPTVSFDDRYHMLKLAIENTPHLEASDIERTIQPSYTVKTLQTLHKEHSATLYLVLGWDAFLGLPSWYEWPTLLSLCHLVVINRDGPACPVPEALVELLKTHSVDTIAPLQEQEAGLIYFQKMPPVAVSSTEIRERLSRGEPVSGLLPEKVIDYITVNHLYGASCESTTHKRGTYAH